MVRFIQEGKRIDYVPTSAVEPGDVVVLGDLVCVATQAIAAGVMGSLAIAGVFRFPMATTSASALAPGAKVYWDAGSGIVTTTAGSNKYVGKTLPKAGSPTVAAAVTDTTVDVCLGQG